MDEKWFELLSVQDMFRPFLNVFQIWHTGLVRDKVLFADLVLCDTGGAEQRLLEVLQTSRIGDEIGASSRHRRLACFLAVRAAAVRLSGSLANTASRL